MKVLPWILQWSLEKYWQEHGFATPSPMYLSSWYSYESKHLWLFIYWPKPFVECFSLQIFIRPEMEWYNSLHSFFVGCSSQALISDWSPTALTHLWVCVLLILPESYSTVTPMVQGIHWLITASESVSNSSSLLGTNTCPDTWIHCTWRVSQKCH